jgi:hypothetical protein
MPDGSKFIGDSPPADCIITSVSSESPGPPASQADALSKTAAEGRKIIEQREAERTAGQARETTSRARNRPGQIVRSSSARRRFLQGLGLTRTPPGCQVDHVIPLAKGGPDVPANMQLLCDEALREKEATELR